MWPWSPSCYGDELLSNAGARPAPEVALTRCCRVPSSDLRRLFRAHELCRGRKKPDDAANTTWA